MSPRSEALRQRAVALGLIQDEGPLTLDEMQREADKLARVGLTEDDLCDELEGLLDAEEDEVAWIIYGEDEA